MTYPLDLSPYYQINSTGQTSATGLLRLLVYMGSHDQVKGWLSSSYLNSTQFWAQAEPLFHGAEQQQSTDAFAVPIVDDFVLKKFHLDPNT